MTPLLWLGVAVVLGIAELLVPGVFLIFLAIAAAVVGVALLALADLPLVAQLGAFAVWSVVTVLIGRRWYVDYPVETSDPLLNDRAARMAGEIVTVSVPIVAGSGRVRVGDSEWPASGPDAEAGARMRVAKVTGGIVSVEPL
ncbi:NfeD family protein [uncultured Sphingomonas sp.]|uniref:NfeD family protein n=1 Tax=Sphingomonas sp. 179-A 2A2 NHS TaxID=3374290 RepID=UPI0025CBB966|nr:NfeD family protein [uncultured Sphingomonas sp.]